MTVIEPARLIGEMVASIEQRGLTVGSAVLFGSAARNDSADDVDCVIILDDRRSDFVPDLAVVRRRMEGDYSSSAPVDHAYEPERLALAAIARRHGFAFWGGFGSIDRDVPDRRVHLQGPCTPHAWRVYADEFPIVAWSIRLNGRLLAGEPLYAGAVTSASVTEFLASMRRRLGARSSVSYARKCVQALQVVLGGQSTDWASARAGVIDAGVFTGAELPDRLTAADQAWVADRALAALETFTDTGPEPTGGRVLRPSTSGPGRHT